jgi:hypothetical protein
MGSVSISGLLWKSDAGLVGPKDARIMADRNRIRNALRRLCLAAAAAVLMPAGAQAQLLGHLPSLPVVGNVGGAVQNTLGGVTQAADRDLEIVRDTVGRPTSAARRWQRDPLGAPIVRGEIVAITPSAQSLAIARGLSFYVSRSETVEGLGLTVVVLQIPDGLSPGDAIAKLRAADPQGTYDFNHIYNPSGAPDPAPPGSASKLTPPQRIGMIDGGVDKEHSAFRGVSLEAAGFVGSCKPMASAHGTAVASLLTGGAEGRIPSLYAADVYCGKAEGGSAEAIVRALGWLAAAGVPVTNVSLAGPPNALLAAGVQAFVARGHVLVAAAGNDGPAAGPRYPAAYPGVIAVTSADEANRIEIDANQGDYIAFAARGVKVSAAKAGGGSARFTGTSFAAPVVARDFAYLVDRPDPQRATWALCVLRHQALDLGAQGRDPVFGFGLVADPITAPAAGACDKAAARQ